MRSRVVVPTIASLILVVGGCVLSGVSKVEHLKLVQSLGISDPTENLIALYIPLEKDYASYYERVDFFDISTIRDELVVALTQETISIHEKDQRGYERSFESRNFLTIVSDPEIADVTVEITVDLFDYGDQRTLGGKIIRFALLGGIGLLGKGEQALLVANYRIVNNHTDQEFAVGVVQELSGEGFVPRIAYRNVVVDGAKGILNALLQF